MIKSMRVPQPCSLRPQPERPRKSPDTRSEIDPTSLPKRLSSECPPHRPIPSADKSDPHCPGSQHPPPASANASGPQHWDPKMRAGSLCRSVSGTLQAAKPGDRPVSSDWAANAKERTRNPRRRPQDATWPGPAHGAFRPPRIRIRKGNKTICSARLTFNNVKPQSDTLRPQGNTPTHFATHSQYNSPFLVCGHGVPCVQNPLVSQPLGFEFGSHTPLSSFSG